MVKYKKIIVPKHTPEVQKLVDEAKKYGWKDKTFKTVQATLYIEDSGGSNEDCEKRSEKPDYYDWEEAEELFS